MYVEYNIRNGDTIIRTGLSECQPLSSLSEAPPSDKLFQGIPINSNTCQAHGECSGARAIVHATAKPEGVNTALFLIS